MQHDPCIQYYGNQPQVHTANIQLIQEVPPSELQVDKHLAMSCLAELDDFLQYGEQQAMNFPQLAKLTCQCHDPE